MGTRADFYVMDHDGSMEWIGSVSQDGGYLSIPTDILISGNQIMFEEIVTDFIKSRGKSGILKGEEGWPWPWADSRMSDYAYIMHICTGKVMVCRYGSRPVDPIKLIQGMDGIGADCGMGLLKFPIMRPDGLELQEETIKLMEDYGSKSTETV